MQAAAARERNGPVDLSQSAGRSGAAAGREARAPSAVSRPRGEVRCRRIMQSVKNIYSLLADLVLLVHFGFVAFVVVGFVVIWVGYFCRWPFVRDLRFRLVHLLAMTLVLAEALAGFVCPLTTWERQLRIRAGDGTGYSGSFIR